MYVPWLILNTRALALKMSDSLKKEHDFIYPFYKGRQLSKLKVQNMFKCDQPQARGGANPPLKGSQT